MMRRIEPLITWVAIALVVTTCPWIVLADDSNEAPARTAEDQLDLLRRDLQQYAIELEADPPVRLTLHETPVLRWTNPARVEEAGAVFLWLHDGRPQVVGTSFTLQSRSGEKKKHSLQSLALSAAAASLDGRVVWHPKVPGISLQLIPDSGVPANTASRRLVEMRAIARKFTVELTPPNKASTHLRFVPQPLYRYASPATGVTDGALFSFAEGTDPEAFLLIEARERDGNTKWHYAFARFNFWSLRASYEQQQVWTAERLSIEGKTLRHALTDPRMRDRTYISYSVPDSTD